MTETRRHSASRTILAPARAIFRAFLDAEAVASWRAPKGMIAQIFAFQPRVGGGYRMAFSYSEGQGQAGTAADGTDIFTGRFIELIPDQTIVETVDFEAEDPAFVGTMTMTTTLLPVVGGTKVTFTAENVPVGISEADHRTGMDSTLKNLANFIE